MFCEKNCEKSEIESKIVFEVVEQLKWRFERMRKIYADGGYRGELVNRVKTKLGYDIEIALRSDRSTNFKPLPKHWIVERTKLYNSPKYLAKILTGAISFECHTVAKNAFNTLYR